MKSQLSLLAPFVVALGAPTAHAEFLTHFEVTQTGSEFSYTVVNDEPLTSSLYVTAFNLTIGAPFTVTSTPAGWDYTTDGLTNINWFNTDLQLPYPHDVAPGSSLGGFTISSAVTTSALLPFESTSWDHGSNDLGPPGFGLALAPAAAVPEPSALALTGLGVALGLLFACRRGRLGTADGWH